MAINAVGEITLVNNARTLATEALMAEIQIDEEFQMSEAYKSRAIGTSHSVTLAGAAIKSRKMMVKAKFDDALDELNWQAIITGKVRPAASATRTILESRRITIPTTPFTQTIAGVGANAASVMFTEQVVAAPGQIAYTNTGGVAPTGTGEFGAADSSGDCVVTFHSSDAGKSGRLVYPRSVTAPMSGGDIGATEWDFAELVVYIDDDYISQKTLYFPRLIRTAGWGIGNQGNGFQRDFLAVAQKGWDDPYLELDTPTLAGIS